MAWHGMTRHGAASQGLPVRPNGNGAKGHLAGTRRDQWWIDGRRHPRPAPARGACVCTLCCVGRADFLPLAACASSRYSTRNRIALGAAEILAFTTSYFSVLYDNHVPATPQNNHKVGGLCCTPGLQDAPLPPRRALPLRFVRYSPDRLADRPVSTSSAPVLRSTRPSRAARHQSCHWPVSRCACLSTHHSCAMTRKLQAE